MPLKQGLLNLSDDELLQLIREDQDYLSVVYKNTRDYCLRFMRKMVINLPIREEELMDVYQDAVIVLYEKIIGGDFQLNSSFQTYLNSVCRNQLLKRFPHVSLAVPLDEAVEWRREYQVDPSVNDVLRELESENCAQTTALEKALQTMKAAGGNCYELLTLFWYHRKSMRQIAERFGYSNEANARNQKAKCQKRLRKMAHLELKGN